MKDYDEHKKHAEGNSRNSAATARTRTLIPTQLKLLGKTLSACLWQMALEMAAQPASTVTGQDGLAGLPRAALWILAHSGSYGGS